MNEKSLAMIEQIQKLKSAGHSERKIARALKISRTTVRKYLEGKLTAVTGRAKNSWLDEVDWEYATGERARGASVKQLFKELAPCVSYNHFTRVLRSKLKVSPKVAPRLSHEPGEKTFVDFCDGLEITCRRTGKKTKTQLFCGVLPFSSFVFAVFCMDQKLKTFIRCHEKMWHYFGGTTPYVVVDNLKAGVKKAHRYDPEENPTYCDYGNHAGFAVIPARPYTPRDKASVEANLGVLQRTFYQEVRNQTFYSLEELNTALRKFLDKLNTTSMKDYGVSRAGRFSKEKHLLRPLVIEPYEIFEWRKAKVHPDCCIQVDKSFYSVPFNYCGQYVRVKLGDQLLEVYDANLESVACHVRSKKLGQVVCSKDHLPPWHIQSSRLELQKCLRTAKSIGEKTHTLVSEWFSTPHPLKYLRRAQGLCRMLKDFDKASLEYACSQALNFKKYRLHYIKSCAQAYPACTDNLLTSLPVRTPQTLHLHGGKNHV